jgi:hypothetical protein
MSERDDFERLVAFFQRTLEDTPVGSEAIIVKRRVRRLETDVCVILPDRTLYTLANAARRLAEDEREDLERMGIVGPERES